MEAIKFSELPSGDRMQLQDEDGLPIIANQENRLLSWGRLKAQLAAQTHTKTVEDDDSKVPTAKAVLTAVANTQNKIAEHLATAKTELTQQINSLRDDLDEQIDDATAKAEGADATAKSALASAGSASRDAQSAENKVIEALAQIKDVKITADTALTTANETKAEVATTNETATTAQTTANEAKTIAESAASQAEEALAKADNSDLDLSPITERLAGHEQTIAEIQEAITITNAEGEEFSIKGELSGVKSLALLAKTDANTAQTTATTAKNLADTLAEKVSGIEEKFYIAKTTTTTNEDGTEQTTTETLPLDQYVQGYEDRIATLETEMTAWTDDIKLLIGQLADTLQGLNS